MAKRKIEKDYYALAKNQGFKWIGKNLPKNVNTKTLWECGNGHRWEAQYNNIYSGNKCPYCSCRIGKTEKDYNILASYYGFEWVGKSLPKTTKTKTKWQCSKNHMFVARYTNIKSGWGCPYCSGKIRKTKNDYIVLAESCKFKWVGKVLPKNIKTKTMWECEKGHRWEARYNNIYVGNGCPICSKCLKKVEYDYCVLARENKLQWVGNFLPRNVMIETLWKCEKGHEFEARYNSIQQKRGCPYCDSRINGTKVSKPQIKLNSLLYGSLNYPESRYRIDVAIMRNSQKIAVEYDAQYWHEGNEECDAKRDKFLISRGWKVLHVKSGEMLPSRKQMKCAINELLKDKNTVNLYLNDWV